MAKVDAFLDSLINYDKENIHPEIIKAIEPYLKDSEFEPEFVRSKSAAAAGLCAWVINIIKFYEVYCDVEPKRKALAQANADLAAAQEKLSGIKRKVAVSTTGCNPGLRRVRWRLTRASTRRTRRRSGRTKDAFF